jgi:hypothetical protein
MGKKVCAITINVVQLRDVAAPPVNGLAAPIGCHFGSPFSNQYYTHPASADVMPRQRKRG